MGIRESNLTAASTLAYLRGLTDLGGGVFGSRRQAWADFVAQLTADAAFSASAGALKVNIEKFGGGVSKTATQNHNAVDTIFSEYGNSPVVICLHDGGQYTFETGISRSKPFWFEGQHPGYTGIRFEPSADATMMQWLQPVGTVPMYGGGFSGLSVYSSDTTYTKQIFDVNAVEWFLLNRVWLGFDCVNQVATAITGGDGCTGAYIKGWDVGRVNEFWSYTDRPVRIGMNPYSFSMHDHWHWSNLYLEMADLSDTFAAIEVDKGTLLSDVTFDGFFAIAGGAGHGFHFDDSGSMINTVASIVAGGSGHAAGDIITLAGGTCTVQPTVRVTRVDGNGAILNAAVANPGTGTGTFPSTASQSGTTGSGISAQFSVGYTLHQGLKFSGQGRSEQGSDSSKYSFYIAPGLMKGLTIENWILDAGRNGIFLKNVLGANIRAPQHRSFSASQFISATLANANGDIEWTNAVFESGSTMDVTGMSKVYSIASGANSSVPKTAHYVTSSTNADFVEGGSAFKTDFAPVVAAQTGTITTAAVTMRYKQVAKRVYYKAQVTITTNGTGAGYVSITLPFASNDNYVGTGRTSSISLSTMTSASTLRIYKASDQSYPGSDGAVLIVSGWYETT